ncbi:SUMF1/EgtB/PvdO family nonheme iron enzyme [Candidatus Sumerlaeota bacterium]|nr:SUMF1/EgtB/PvdO family nonheme iron enzyme [Candidatus Sumerlaeota bacterium]
MIRLTPLITALALLAACATPPPGTSDNPVTPADPPHTFSVDDLGMESVTIPAGWFWMGSFGDEVSEADRDELPRHRVWLDAYEIGVTEVTNAQFAAFLNDARPTPEERLSWVIIRTDLERGGYQRTYPTEIREVAPGVFVADPQRVDHPVTSVSWHGAVAMARWLTERTGRVHRLPTEAEWECAARGGLSGAPYPWGIAPPDQSEHVFGRGWGLNSNMAPTEPAGSGVPNELGLHRVADNVWEWTGDWYQADWYSLSPDRNPTGPEEGTERVLRGGSWDTPAEKLRVADRRRLPPDAIHANAGFRLVREIAAPQR